MITWRFVLLLIGLSFITQGFSQNEKNTVGFKAGGNISKYTPNDDPYEYEHITGFYVGAFYRIKLLGKFSFKPEIILSRQGSKVINTVNPILLGFDPFIGDPYDSEFEVYDYVIAIPLTTQWHITNRLYLTGGPQLNFIVDQHIEADGILFSETGFGYEYEDYDTFELAATLGLGFTVITNLSIQASGFVSVLERNNNFRSVVFQLGLEYTL